MKMFKLEGIPVFNRENSLGYHYLLSNTDSPTEIEDAYRAGTRVIEFDIATHVLKGGLSRRSFGLFDELVCMIATSDLQRIYDSFNTVLNAAQKRTALSQLAKKYFREGIETPRGGQDEDEEYRDEEDEEEEEMQLNAFLFVMIWCVTAMVGNPRLELDLLNKKLKTQLASQELPLPTWSLNPNYKFSRSTPHVDYRYLETKRTPSPSADISKRFCLLQMEDDDGDSSWLPNMTRIYFNMSLEQAARAYKKAVERTGVDLLTNYMESALISPDDLKSIQCFARKGDLVFDPDAVEYASRQMQDSGLDFDQLPLKVGYESSGQFLQLFCAFLRIGNPKLIIQLEYDDTPTASTRVTMAEWERTISSNPNIRIECLEGTPAWWDTKVSRRDMSDFVTKHRL